MPLTPSAQVIAQAVAMAQLYDNIASGAIAQWDVQNISQAYNHLRLVYVARGDTAATAVALRIRFNNDSGANYDGEKDYGNNVTPASAVTPGVTGGELIGVPAASATANKAGCGVVFIPNYTGTTFEKIATGFGGRSESIAAAGQYSETDYVAWRSTAAINRITLFPTAGNIIAGSRLTIYGLL